MEEAVQSFLNTIGQITPWVACLFFFVSALLQTFFPPYPGDTVLIAGGYMGTVGLFGGSIPVFLTFWTGTILSSYILYLVAYHKGAPILNIRIITRYFPVKSQQKAKNIMERYGVVALFICKFVPGVNSLIILFAGIFRYKPIWAYIGIGVATLVHNIAFFLVGKLIGSNISLISRFLSTYNRIVIAIIAAGMLVFVLYWLRTRRTQAD